MRIHRPCSGPRAALLATSVSLLIGLAAPVQADCGDCDGNGATNILDALLVAQAAVGLIPSPTPVSCCDFNGDGNLNILDALQTAQAAVGLPASPMCAGVTVAPANPGGLPSNNLIEFTLTNAFGDDVDLVVEWTTDGGNYLPATRYGLNGEGLTGLSTDPGGASHMFAWDWFADLRTTTVVDADLRFTAGLCGSMGTPASTGPFSFTYTSSDRLLVSCQNQPLFGSMCGTPGTLPHQILEVDPAGGGVGQVTSSVDSCEFLLNWGEEVALGPGNMQTWLINSLGNSSISFFDRAHNIEIGDREFIGSAHSTGQSGGIQLSPSEAFMAVSIGNPVTSQFRLYDPYSRQLMDTILWMPGGATHFAFDGTDNVAWVITEGRSDSNIYLLDIPGRAVLTSVDLGVGNQPNDIVFNPATDSFFVSIATGAGCPDLADVIEIDRSTRLVTRTINFDFSETCGPDENPDGLALDDNGRFLAVALAIRGRLAIVNTSTGSLIGAPDTGNSPRDVVWHSASNLFYCYNVCNDLACSMPIPTLAAVDVSGAPVKTGFVDLSPARLPAAVISTR